MKLVSEQLNIPEEIKHPFDIQEMNDLVAEEIPPTKKLIGTLIYPEEFTLLFGKSNVGKSVLGMQIAEVIGTGFDLNLGNGVILPNECEPMKVIFYDFELSKKQFQKRYEKEHQFKNVYRATLKRSEYMGVEPKKMIKKLRAGADSVGAKVMIVDNISAISGDIEKSDKAVEFMQSLLRLAKDDFYTIIVIAHTPKLPDFKPLSLEHISGSNKINQLTDGAIAIGEVNANNEYYIIHLKGRNDAKEYHKGNVIHTSITKGTSVVHEAIGLRNEMDLLLGSNDGSHGGNSNRMLFVYACLYYGNSRKALKILQGAGYDVKHHTNLEYHLKTFRENDSKKYKELQEFNDDELKELMECQNNFEDCLPLKDGHINKNEIPF